MKGISVFSGPGGSSTGMKMAGIEDVVGIEWDESAVATARAAGHRVHQADVRDVDPHEFYKTFLCEDDWGQQDFELLLQLSPPCQGLSMAGKGKGRDDLVHLFEAIDHLIDIARRDGSIYSLRKAQAEMGEWLKEVCSDERSPLTFEVVRWILELVPEHVMLEQVPAALPIWQKVLDLLIAMGYAGWTDTVTAEQYGVPQTRKRAMLLATRNADEVPAPVPTHSKYHNRTPERLDAGVEKWISMAEALGWGMTKRPYPTVAPGTGGGGPDPMAVGGSGARKIINGAYDNGDWVERPTHMGDVVQKNGTVRSIHQPAPTLTASMDNGNWRWVFDREALIEEVTPRVNNQSGTEFDLGWPADRPSPVVAGRDIITMPGANANRFNGSTKSRNDGIKVTVEEAGVIQGFSYEYPWQGTKTKKFEQVGNAVPPPLQAAMTVHLLACASERTEPEALETTFYRIAG